MNTVKQSYFCTIKHTLNKYLKADVFFFLKADVFILYKDSTFQNKKWLCLILTYNPLGKSHYCQLTEIFITFPSRKALYLSSVLLFEDNFYFYFEPVQSLQTIFEVCWEYVLCEVFEEEFSVKFRCSKISLNLYILENCKTSHFLPIN